MMSFLLYIGKAAVATAVFYLFYRLLLRKETFHRLSRAVLVGTCLVLSRADWEAPHDSILAHERAHIANKHSIELLLVDVMIAFQWFNPAIWMLRADLQELHEYEADEAVLQGGANLSEYQYLLVRKAFSDAGYSVANSFSHSTLKNRLRMMSRTPSASAHGLKALYVLPLVRRYVD